MNMTMTKQRAIEWMLRYVKASKMQYWYGAKFNSVEECQAAIEKDLKARSKAEVLKEARSFGAF